MAKIYDFFGRGIVGDSGYEPLPSFLQYRCLKFQYQQDGIRMPIYILAPTQNHAILIAQKIGRDLQPLTCLPPPSPTSA